jgi:hypothetical protein
MVITLKTKYKQDLLRPVLSTVHRVFVFVKSLLINMRLVKIKMQTMEYSGKLYLFVKMIKLQLQ